VNDYNWPGNTGCYWGNSAFILPIPKHKVIRHYTVSDAAMNDRRLLADVLDENNTSRALWADTNYRSRAQEA